jgi:hypothetical protein
MGKLRNSSHANIGVVLPSMQVFFVFFYGNIVEIRWFPMRAAIPWMKVMNFRRPRPALAGRQGGLPSA